MTTTTILSDNGVSSGTAGIKTTGGNDGTLQLQTTTSGGAATTALTIDTSQNVGIGTSSPLLTSAGRGNVTVNGSSASIMTLGIAGTWSGYLFASGSGLDLASNSSPVTVTAGGANYVGFNTNGSERGRFDTNGTLLVGTTTSNSAYRMRVTSGGTTSATYAALFETSSAGNIFYLRSDGYINSGVLGASPYNYTTATAANACFLSDGSFARSTSALKYKTDIRDLETVDITKFRPVRYKSTCETDNKTNDHIGFVADEYVDTYPELVAIGENGEVEGFAYERMTAILCKAIQELKAEIDELKGAQA